MKLSFQNSSILLVVAASAVLSPTVHAAVITFDTDPFAGSTALTTPGRQIVGGEPSVTFSPATDTYAFNPAVFSIGSGLHFANGLVGDLPTGGINVVVLQSFDDDANPGTPFGAGNAASLIAGHITSPGPGFFVYFNSGLNLARLVYSTDLNDSTADLKILARMTNLTGQSGRDAFPTFTAANFQIAQTVPEGPSTLPALFSVGAVLLTGRIFRLRGPANTTG